MLSFFCSCKHFDVHVISSYIQGQKRFWFCTVQAWTHKVVRSSSLKEGFCKALGTSKRSKGKKRKLFGVLSVPSHQTHPILSASLPFHASLFLPFSIQSHLSSITPSLPSIFPSHRLPFHFPILSHPLPSHPTLSFYSSPFLPSIPSLLSQITLPFLSIPSHTISPQELWYLFEP